MNATDSTLSEARAVAEALVGAPVNIRHLLTGGRNSRIYQVSCGADTFALKQYPSRRDDPRDRLATEVGALRLMERSHLATVPQVVGVDSDRGYALLSWIDGVEVDDIAERDIDAAVAFLGEIHSLRQARWAAEQPPAAEACLSGEEIERQIAERVAGLRAGSPDEPHLIDFLENTVGPETVRRVRSARESLQAAGLDFGADLPQEWRTLVPSDFGFHNSLRRKDGSLAFVDFEYFGWDDPVKLTADILLHPGRPLSGTQRRRFQAGAQTIYGADGAFAPRLKAYLPLFGLRWVLILLNEFLPERWRRRQLAGATESWSDAKARQLGRAKDFLLSLPAKVEN